MKRDQNQICITSSIGPAVAFPPTLNPQNLKHLMSSTYPNAPTQHQLRNSAQSRRTCRVAAVQILNDPWAILPLDALTNWFRQSEHQLSPFLTATDGEVTHILLPAHRLSSAKQADAMRMTVARIR